MDAIDEATCMNLIHINNLILFNSIKPLICLQYKFMAIRASSNLDQIKVVACKCAQEGSAIHVF